MSKNNNSSLNKNTLNYINRNIIFPNAAGPFPLAINEMTPTIEIIEINSDESEKRCKNKSLSHVNIVFENYARNRKTEDKNPLKYKQDYTYEIKNNNKSSTDDDLNETFNSHYGGNYEIGEEMIYNQVKCLKNINNNIRSDTSSEADRYFDIIHFNDTVCDDILWNSNSYTIMGSNDNSRKPANWIYSFKNNKYSYENDYDLSRTNSNHSTNCSTVTDDEEVTNKRNIFATSIFNSIPKFKLLSSPLPTVTEITEPNKQSSPDIIKISPDCRIFKNSWVENNSHEIQKRLEQNVNTSSKLSTLSQRERRRTKVAKILSKQVEENAPKNVYSKPKIYSTQNVGNTKNSLMNISNSTALAVNQNAADDEVDVLDVTNLYFSSSQNEQLKLSAQSTKSAKAISDQVEKLEKNWIDTANNIEIVDVYDYDLDTADGSGVQNISHEEGTSIFAAKIVSKPTDFSQNAAVANNVPFLHLSFETDFDEDKKSCFKRFYNFINCCK